MSNTATTDLEHAAGRPRVVITFREALRGSYLAEADLERLRTFAEPVWIASEDGKAAPALLDALSDAQALVICHGAPEVDAALLERAPHLRFLGEMEGDRFASRIDVAAAHAREITVVDTTNGSSYPVAEWALALMMMALRNAGWYFRRLIAGEPNVREAKGSPGNLYGELTEKRVGLIGCGHIGRRLLEYLKPFRCEVRVYDPYLPPEIADAYDFIQTSLELVMRESDVVVVLAPLTPKTRGMIGARELAWLQPHAAFVNVSRGGIVDSQALIERLRGSDLRAALDVFDPEPIPVDSEIRQLPNVFLSPHIAGTTAASRPRFFELMVDELERFFRGYQPRYVLHQRSLANRRGEDEVSV